MWSDNEYEGIHSNSCPRYAGLINSRVGHLNSLWSGWVVWWYSIRDQGKGSSHLIIKTLSRPLRIEYENAFYHVINRGRKRQNIFYGEAYFRAFLATLAEAQQQFGCALRSYCLMSNHYPLLIEPPNANPTRVMRHINGVYTQRYNRLNGLMRQYCGGATKRFWSVRTNTLCNCHAIFTVNYQNYSLSTR